MASSIGKRPREEAPALDLIRTNYSSDGLDLIEENYSHKALKISTETPSFAHKVSDQMSRLLDTIATGNLPLEEIIPFEEINCLEAMGMMLKANVSKVASQTLKPINEPEQTDKAIALLPIKINYTRPEESPQWIIDQFLKMAKTCTITLDAIDYLQAALEMQKNNKEILYARLCQALLLRANANDINQVLSICEPWLKPEFSTPSLQEEFKQLKEKAQALQSKPPESSSLQPLASDVSNKRIIEKFLRMAQSRAITLNAIDSLQAAKHLEKRPYEKGRIVARLCQALLLKGKGGNMIEVLYQCDQWLNSARLHETLREEFQQIKEKAEAIRKS